MPWRAPPKAALAQRRATAVCDLEVGAAPATPDTSLAGRQPPELRQAEASRHQRTVTPAGCPRLPAGACRRQRGPSRHMRPPLVVRLGPNCARLCLAQVSPFFAERSQEKPSDPNPWTPPSNAVAQPLSRAHTATQAQLHPLTKASTAACHPPGTCRPAPASQHKRSRSIPRPHNALRAPGRGARSSAPACQNLKACLIRHTPQFGRIVDLRNLRPILPHQGSLPPSAPHPPTARHRRLTPGPLPRLHSTLLP